MVPCGGLVKEREMRKKRGPRRTDRQTDLCQRCSSSEHFLYCRRATAGFRRDSRRRGQKCRCPQRVGGRHVSGCLVLFCFSSRETLWRVRVVFQRTVSEACVSSISGITEFNGKLTPSVRVCVSVTVVFGK